MIAVLSLFSLLHAAEFTDRDLGQTLRSSCAGARRCIFFVWSPHMPLSVLGREKLLAFAKPKSIRVITLLDADASPNLAEEIRSEYHWPAETLVHQSARTLYDLGSHVHAPSYIFAKGGRISGPLVPAMQSSKNLEYFERRYLR